MVKSSVDSAGDATAHGAAARTDGPVARVMHDQNAISDA